MAGARCGRVAGAGCGRVAGARCGRVAGARGGCEALQASRARRSKGGGLIRFGNYRLKAPNARQLEL